MITLSIVKNTIPAEQRRAGMFFQRAEGKRLLRYRSFRDSKNTHHGQAPYLVKHGYVTGLQESPL
jgi:hypothetical protein